MIKHIERRALSLLLAIVLVLSALPLQAWAATLFTTTVLDGKVSVSGDGTSGLGTGTNSNDVITITASAEKDDCKGTYTPKAHTVTISNATTDEELTLSFDYEASDFGAFTVAGVDKASAPKGNWGGKLVAGASVTIVLTSKDNDTVANLTLSGFELQTSESRTVTVKPDANGTITVGGKTITADETVTTDFATGVAVSAVPKSGYVFLAWVDADGNVVSTEAATTIQPKANITVKAMFVAKNTQGYWMGGNRIHMDLNAAIAAAQSSDGLVVLLKDATISGTYTIPSGVKVLIPHDAAKTHYGANPELAGVNDEWVQPTPYVTLTLAANTTINVKGNLELAALHTVAGGSRVDGGTITGKFGHISTEGTAKIDVKSGGTLYTWGIVSGSGTVEVQSGGTVYEKMQITDYRGGAITSLLAMTHKGEKLFPFSQYYCQNVEVLEIIHAGGKLLAHAGVYVSAPEKASIEFVGGSGAMFGLTSGYVTKKYNAAKDRLEIDLYGNASVNSIGLSVGGQSINSSDFRLGINNNISLSIHSGVTTINQDMVLQPGASVTVDREATLYNTKEVYIVDAEDWGTFCRGAKIIPVKWSYANGTTVKRTAVSDAVVDINGTVLSGGQIYTSGNESVTSSGKTGVYILQTSANATGSISQVTDNVRDNIGIIFKGSAWTSIAHTAAVLVNGDNTTTATSNAVQYDAFIYDSIQDKWVKQNIYNNGAGCTATLTYDANGGTGSVASKTIDYLTTAGAFAQTGVMAPLSFALAQNEFTREGYDFVGWSTDASATETAFTPSKFVTIAADTTVYAVWEAKKFDLTVIVNEGDASDPIQVAFGTPLMDENGNQLIPTEKPTKDGFEFAGWTVTKADGTAIEAPATMPAHDVIFTANWAKAYTLTFVDENGNVLKDAEGKELVYTYAEGETVTATYPEYTKPNYTITWSAEIPETLTADLEISAIVTANTFTLTFLDEKGDEIFVEELAEGAAITVPTYAPEGFAFKGWRNVDTGEIETVPATMPNNELTYQAVLAELFDIRFFVGDEMVQNSSVAKGDLPEYTGTEPAKETDDVSHYEFYGWNTKADGTGTGIATVAGNADYYALFIPVKHSFTGAIKSDGNGKDATHSFLCDRGCGQYGGAVTHTWGEGVVNPDSTCLGTGTKTYTCTADGCGATYTEAVAAKGHTFGAITAAKAATCEADGNEAYKQCSVCDLYFAADAAANAADGKADASSFAISQKQHSFTGAYKDNEDGTHSQKCVNGCNAYGQEVAHDFDNDEHKCVCEAVQTFIVTWVVDGQTKYTENVKYGEDAPVKEVPAKTGHTGTWDQDGKNITEPTTITATYTANTYTVSLLSDNNGVEIVSGTTATYGKDLTVVLKNMASADSARIYVGQYTVNNVAFGGDEYTNTITIPGNAVTGNIVIDAYALVNVQINLNGGSVISDDWKETIVPADDVANIEVLYDTTWCLKDVFGKTGYTFVGMKDAQGVAYTADADIYINKDLQLDVQWEAKIYTITWDVEGVKTTTTVKHGETPTHVAPTKADDAQYTYEFAGWTPKVVAATGPATYTAQFAATPKEYNIFWDWAGIANSWKYGEEITQADPGRTGYTFGGWKFWRADISDAINGNVVKHEVYEGNTMPAYDMYAEAQWILNQYTLTIDMGEHGTVGGAATVEVKAEYKAKPDVPEIIANEGYKLTGWTVKIGENTTTATELPTEMLATDATYTAVWELIDVTVNFNEGETKSLTGKYFDEVTAPTATREGYTFLGWAASAADDAQVLYEGGAKITLNNSVADKTLYAKWQVNTFEVTYVNGESSEKNTVDWNTEITVEGLADTASHTFEGWLGSDGKTYKAGDKVTIKANLTLTAQWKIKSYTITWDVEGTKTTTTVNHGETPEYKGTTPVKKSTAQYTFTFAGWGNIVPATGPATYTAQFTYMLRSYDITFVVDGQENKVPTEYGKTPVYDADGKVPEKATDAQYSYKFAGWTPALETVKGEATYTATWTETPVEHTITFMVDGKIWKQYKGGYSTSVDYSELITPSKTGHSFAWDKQQTEWPPNIPAEDMVITGTYTPNTYTITFKGDFNTEKDDAFGDYTITKKYGEAITETDIAALNATLPNITGWEFLGWYNAEEVEIEGKKVWEHTSKYEIPEKMGFDVEVYACWEAVVYDLIVKSSITDEQITGSSMRYEESYNDLAKFNHVNNFCYDPACDDESHEECLLPDGYTFEGYKYADGTDMSFPIDCWPAEDVTIVAQFKPIDYTVVFYDDYGSKIGSITAPFGSDIRAQVKEIADELMKRYSGFDLSYWADALEDGKSVQLDTMPLNGASVYAQLTIKEFALNFRVNGQVVATFPVPFLTTLTTGKNVPSEYLQDLIDQVTVPQVDYFTFTGWDIRTLEGFKLPTAENIDAILTPIRYNITVNMNGGTANGSGDETYTRTHYETVFCHVDLVKEGHTFSHFVDQDGNIYAPATLEKDGNYYVLCENPVKDMTFTAVWTANTYTINFEMEGIAPITAAYGADITWPANPTKTGFAFQGWDENDDGVADITTALTKMPAGNKILKPVWAKNTIYITWDIDGKETIEEYQYGDTITAPEATKATDAKWIYKFAGWDKEIPATALVNDTYTAQFAEDEAVKYNVKFVNGETTVYETKIAWNGQVTLDGFTAPTQTGHALKWTVDGAEASFPYAMDTKEVTFVANWTPNTYTITIDNGEPVEYVYGAVLNIETPAKEGHTFIDWTVKTALGEAVGKLPTNMPAYDLVLTSNWEIDSYTLTIEYCDETGAWQTVEEDVPYGTEIAKFVPETPSFQLYGLTMKFASWNDGEKDVTLPEKMGAERLYFTARYTATGWFTDENGNTTYLIDSEKEHFNEMVKIGDDQYYFDGESYIVKDITLIGGEYYAFDHETGKFLSNLTGIYEAKNGDLYWVENGIAAQNKGLVRIIENNHIHYYYFGCGVIGCTDVNCAGEYKAQKTIRHWAENTNGYLMQGGYTFGNDGVIEHTEDTNRQGIQTIDGVKYYLMDGVKVPYGLFKIGNDYYYARSSGALAVDTVYWVSGSKLNGLNLKAGNYQFDADGKIVFPAEHGFHEIDGVWYYYEDGKVCYKGLFWFDGTTMDFGDHWNPGPTAEGGAGWYYINSNGILKTDCTYWISKNNGYKVNQAYTFDKNGKMVITEEETKNGFYYEDGKYFYYEDGLKTYAGLIWSDGPEGNDPGYYYINSKCYLITNQTYWITKNNGYMKNMSYTFGANGKMVGNDQKPEDPQEPSIPETPKDVPADHPLYDNIKVEGDKWFYCEDGVKTYAGLILVDGNYYYVKTSGEIVRNCSYWISKNNGYMKNRSYTFDVNGVITDPQPIG